MRRLHRQGHSRAIALILLTLFSLPATAYLPCVSCQVDAFGCTYCIGNRGDVEGAKCRTGGQVGCPVLCMAEDACGPPQPPPLPRARFMIGVTSGATNTTSISGKDGGELAFPYTPRPWADLTLHHAEIVVATECDSRDLRITDGALLIGLGIHTDPEMEGNRKFEIRDSRGSVFFRGSFEQGTRLAVPVPGSEFAIVFEWRPMLSSDADEMAAQRQFFASLHFSDGSKWSAVQEGWEVQRGGGKQ